MNKPTITMNDAAWEVKTLPDGSIVESSTGEVIVPPAAVAAAAGKALESLYPWGYNSGDNEP